MYFGASGQTKGEEGGPPPASECVTGCWWWTVHAVRGESAVHGDASREVGRLRRRHEHDFVGHQGRREIQGGRRPRSTMAPTLLRLPTTGAFPRSPHTPHRRLSLAGL